MWRKNNKAVHLTLVLTNLFWNLFNTQKHFALALKKIIHLLFCVFQTKLNKAVSIFCRILEWIRNVQMIPGFSRRLWWEHGWNSCMGNSKDWRSKKVNVIELNCKVVKKVATPHFYINPPFSSLSLLSHKKIHTSQVIQFLKGPTPPPPPPLIRCRVWGGGGQGPTM